MLRVLRTVAAACALCGPFAATAFAQTPALVFTAPVPGRTSAEPVMQSAAAVVEERGLALWSGTASDFGIGVALSGSRWTVRAITSMTALPIVGGYSKLTFQQIEAIRPLFAHGSTSVAGGGGVREEWDGTQVLFGRVLAGTDVGRGRLQGSLVLERAFSSPLDHDAADVVTTVGWSRRVSRGLSVGLEGIGQDIEGLWDPAEAEGGAKLLVGPSLHAQSSSGKWAARITAGPVIQTQSTAALPDVRAALQAGGYHFGFFASATWLPSLPH